MTTRKTANETAPAEDSPPDQPDALRFIGNGSARIPGVARRDLAAADIDRIGPVLIAIAIVCVLLIKKPAVRESHAATSLDTMLAGRHRQIDLVIRLKVDHLALLSRIGKRYEEEGRPDDNPASFETRLSAYAAQTAPLLPYYAVQGKLYEVDGMADVGEVARQVDALLATIPG